MSSRFDEKRSLGFRLFKAARGGDVSRMMELVIAGADPFARDKKGRSVMARLMAAKRGGMNVEAEGGWTHALRDIRMQGRA